jgi:multiple antibiotic resistance protein
MSLDLALSAFVTLLVTVDPIGLAPMFLTVTNDVAASSKPGIAWRAGAISFLVLTVFALVGEVFLNALGIGLPALRIAGGLLLFWIAFEMIFAKRQERQAETLERVAKDSDFHLAAVPLAIPMVAGPGAITAVILLSSRTQADVVGKLLLVALIGAVILACVASFLAAARISRRLGETGAAVLSRLLGVILTALAVQFVIDGVKEVLG